MTPGGPLNHDPPDQGNQCGNSPKSQGDGPRMCPDGDWHRERPADPGPQREGRTPDTGCPANRTGYLLPNDAGYQTGG